MRAIANSYRNNKWTAGCIPGGIVELYPQSRQLTCIRLLGSPAVGETEFNTVTYQSLAGRGHLFDKSAKLQYVITFHTTLITSA